MLLKELGARCLNQLKNDLEHSKCWIDEKEKGLAELKENYKALEFKILQLETELKALEKA